MFGFGKKTIDLDAQRDALLKAFAALDCPGVCKDLIESGIIGAFTADKGVLTVEVTLPTPALKNRVAFEKSIEDAARGVLGDVDVNLMVTHEVKSASGDMGKASLPGIKNVILVASGKGGVGKSTVASNLAVALAKLGAKTGLLDADIYGPSAPTMFGIVDGTRPGTIPSADAERPLIAPLDRYGVRLMSIGFLVDTSTPMVWRGPMIASAAMQLFKDVAWGELDYLVVDMPPGTGDVQLTISQQVMVAGAIVVSTPQDVALADVVRAKSMFDKVSIPILGVIENMSYFICDGCNKRHEIFTHGGAKAAALRMGVAFLGEVPLEPGVVTGGDSGTPIVTGHPESASAQAFVALAEEVATTLAKTAADMGEPIGLPSISISGGALGKGPKKGGLPIIS
jgi:ATP-binding protein involved in chromosome partitioning